MSIWCKSCKKTSSFLLLRVTEEVLPHCKTCGTRDLKRKVSCVTLLRGNNKTMKDILNPSTFSGLDENDPACIERVMNKMGKGPGNDLGEGFEEAMEGALGDKGPIPEQTP